KDEVLQITSEKQAQGKLTTVTYLVTDLVVPVQNFGDLSATPYTPFLTPAPRDNPFGAPEQPVPLQQPMSLNGGTPVGTPKSSFATQSPGGTTMTVSKPTETRERQLIELITRTIQPNSWYESGGPGTIDFFPLTMALVINQTPDIQEQVADLLAALRRLQD